MRSAHKVPHVVAQRAHEEPQHHRASLHPVHQAEREEGAECVVVIVIGIIVFRVREGLCTPFVGRDATLRFELSNDDRVHKPK